MAEPAGRDLGLARKWRHPRELHAAMLERVQAGRCRHDVAGDRCLDDVDHRGGHVIRAGSGDDPLVRLEYLIHCALERGRRLERITPRRRKR